MGNYFGNFNGIDTKDYVLMMDGTTVVARPQDLVGHTVTSPNVDLSDALTVTQARLQNGRIKTVTITKRAPEERGRQYTIGFPPGALWTPVMQLALRTGCRSTFYMKYLCPADVRLEHAEILPDALLDPVQPEGDLILTEEEAVVAYTSTLRISEQRRLWGLGYSKIFTEAADTPLYSVDFATADCPTCSDVPGLGFFVGGGDGVAVPLVLGTEDRFADTDTLVTGGAAAQIATATENDGALLLEGLASAAVPTALATGSLRVSRDAGATWAAATGVTSPIYDIVITGSAILAVGGVGAGAAKVFASFDRAVTWTDVASTALSATEALTSISYDVDSDAFYAVGEGGTLYKLTISGTSVTISDLSANLPGAPGLLKRVKVLAKDFVAVGGAAGYYAESFDGGATFAQRSVSGAVAISGIAGNRYRTVVSAGTALYERDVLNDYEFALVTLESGVAVTGDYTEVTEVETYDGNFNMFIAVTDEGEVVLGKPRYPNA